MTAKKLTKRRMTHLKPVGQADLPRPFQNVDYVGYKHPPKSTQFQRGKSGNPSGRPKRKKDIRDSIDKVLFKPIKIRENGRLKRVPAIEGMLSFILNAGLKGDLKAVVTALKLALLIGKAATPSDKDIERYNASIIKSASDEELDQAIVDSLREMGYKIVPLDDKDQSGSGGAPCPGLLPDK